MEDAMSRIAPADPAGLPPDAREVLAAEVTRYGAPLNTTRVWARRPDLLLAYRTFGQAMSRLELISPALKYLVYVRVASLNGCPF
jgi:alkylhydroperoxidase family enzyme